MQEPMSRKARTATSVAIKTADMSLGLTLANLRTFVEQCESAGLEADTRIGGGVGWRGQLQKVETRPAS